MAAQAALSASAFIAPVASRVASKSAKKSRAFRYKCNAIYTESARVPSPDDDRRWRETQRVLQRTQEIHTMTELSAAFQLAGDKLVMVAVESDEECTMTDEWIEASPGQAGSTMEDCRQLSSSLSRIAREADDVAFLKVEVVGDNSAREVAHQLGVTRYPTYQYYKVSLRRIPPLSSLPPSPFAPSCTRSVNAL